LKTIKWDVTTGVYRKY